jgi:hypothetical protein
MLSDFFIYFFWFAMALTLLQQNKRFFLFFSISLFDRPSDAMDASNGQPRRYGTTGPISVAFPTPRDEQLSRHLEEYLRASGLFESREESENREEVLGKLNNIIRDWVHNVSLKKVTKRRPLLVSLHPLTSFHSLLSILKKNPGPDRESSN